MDIRSPSNGGCWIFCFYRRLHGYKVDTFKNLLWRLQGLRVRSDEEDSLVWKGEKNEAFSSKALY